MAEIKRIKPTGAYVAKDVVVNEVMNMIRGTTPTHTFKLPFDVDIIKSVMIVYAQRNKEILRKETADCTMEGEDITTTLTQEETFKFNHVDHVHIQLRVLTKDGTAMVSEPKVVNVKDCLNYEVLT